MNDKVKLDLKDRKILLELDFNARQSNSEIAKKVGLSKQGVDYRIKNMINKGIIKGFYPVINITKLGYYYCRLFLKFQNLTKKKEEEIYTYLKSNKKINWIVKFYGTYDVIIASNVKSISEFKRIVDEFVSKFGFYIKEKKESILLDLAHFQYRFLLDKKETKEIHIKEEKESIELDELDKEILEMICQDARMPLVDVAQKVKTTTNITAYRIKKVEKNGIILGYRPDINNNMLGWTHYKILFYLMNVKEKDMIRLRSYFKNNPNVIYIVDEVGICDMDIEAMFKSQQEFFDFIEKVKFAFPNLIKDYESFIASETLKINYLPFD